MRAIRSPVPLGYGECACCDALTPTAEIVGVCPSCLGRLATSRASTVPARPAAPVEVFYSVPDAADILKVSAATVRGYIASGVLPARQLGMARDRRGTRYRIARRDLARFLHVRQTEGA